MSHIRIHISKEGTAPKISGDVHAVPDDLEDFPGDEAFGLGHEAGVGDLEEFRTKITKLYEDWNPPEDNEIATQYKFELGHMLGLHKEGGCG